MAVSRIIGRLSADYAVRESYVEHGDKNPTMMLQRASFRRRFIRDFNTKDHNRRYIRSA